MLCCWWRDLVGWLRGVRRVRADHVDPCAFVDGGAVVGDLVVVG